MRVVKFPSHLPLWKRGAGGIFLSGNVEKSRQRRSLALPKRLARHRRHFAAFGLTDLSLFATFALTSCEYALRTQKAAALAKEKDWDWAGEIAENFDHSRRATDIDFP